jgi:hypothetical protein
MILSSEQTLGSPRRSSHCISPNQLPAIAIRYTYYIGGMHTFQLLHFHFGFCCGSHQL